MCIVVKNLRHFRSTAAFASFFGGCQGQKGTENPLYLFLYRGFCSADAVPQPPGGVYAVRRELCGAAYDQVHSIWTYCCYYNAKPLQKQVTNGKIPRDFGPYQKNHGGCRTKQLVRSLF